MEKMKALVFKDVGKLVLEERADSACEGTG